MTNLRCFSSLLLISIGALSVGTDMASGCPSVQSPDKTYRDEFIDPGTTGALAWSFESAPTRYNLAMSDECYRAENRQRIQFFVNHETNLDFSETSFLAIQIIKNFKTLRFADQTFGNRVGEWHIDEGSVDEIHRVKSFRGLTPQEFIDAHQSGVVNKEILTESLGQPWHAYMTGTSVASWDYPEYWRQAVPESETIQVENLIIRFSTLPMGSNSSNSEYGINFNTGVHDNLAEMEVRVYSPLSTDFHRRFWLVFD